MAGETGGLVPPTIATRARERSSSALSIKAVCGMTTISVRRPLANVFRPWEMSTKAGGAMTSGEGEAP